MDTIYIYINSRNSRISSLRRLLLSHTSKINLKRSGKYVALYME